jgi:hypothetical protein
MMQDGYANSSLILESLRYIGISNVREKFVDTGKAASQIEALADAGVHFDFIANSYLAAQGASGMAKYIAALSAFRADHPDAILSFEGLNEANVFAFSYNGQSTIAAAAQFQEYLYTSIKSNAGLADIPVYNFSIAYNTPENYAQMGDVSAYSDGANIHLYNSTTGSVDSKMEYAAGLASGASSGDPLVITEIGHTTLSSEPSIGTSETAQAKMMLSELLLAYENGSEATYIYELLDSSAQASRGEKEAHFGLFYENGAPKAAATALHNFTTILKFGDLGASSASTPGTVSVDNASTTTHAMTMTKSGDVYDVLVWNDRSVWNDALDVDYDNPAISTTVSFGQVEDIVRVYDPMAGLAPIATYTNVSSITLALKDSPLIVEVGATAAVSESSYSTGAAVTMTAAEFIANIDLLAQSDTLQHITISDTDVLPVSSVETLAYIVGKYAGTLAKIDDAHSFSVSYGDSAFRTVLAFDASGAQTLSTIYGYETDGSLRSISLGHPDGSSEYYRYGITGQNYTSEHQGHDADGFQTLLDRFHADGSYNLHDVRDPDGSRIYESYDDLGRISNRVLTAADGSTLSERYDTGGVVVSRNEVAVDGDLTQTVFTNGAPTKVTVVATEGWTEITTYSDTTGHKLTWSLRDADGTRHYSTYGSAEQLLSDWVTSPDGSKLGTTYLQDGTGDVRVESYDAAAKLLVRDVAHTNGNHEVSAYADNQHLVGGELNDTFYFRTTGGSQLVYEGGADVAWNFNTDATGVDYIRIGSEWASDFDDLTITQQGANVLVSFDAADSILIRQQSLSQVLEDHFLFV